MQHHEPRPSAIATAVVEGGSPAQATLLDRLRAGDRLAFTELVDGWSPMLLRGALLHVSTRASAEEVAQDTWLAVTRQVNRFEGRSSLRTRVLRILENQARSRGVRGSRVAPWSSALGEDVGPTVAPREPPPGDAAVAAEIRRELRQALDELPERQRAVVELRDVHGLSSDDVCEQLGLSSGNQRNLQHRGLPGCGRASRTCTEAL